MVHSVPTPGWDNPDDINTTAIVDTGANISLLNTNTPVKRLLQQTPPKSIIRTKGPMLTAMENLVLLLNKLPTNVQLAYRTPGIKNNLIAASELVDAGCELFFHQHGCEAMLNGEIILRGWRDPITKLWHISLLSTVDKMSSHKPQTSKICLKNHTNYRLKTYTNASTRVTSLIFILLQWDIQSLPHGARQLIGATSEGGQD